MLDTVICYNNYKPRPTNGKNEPQQRSYIFYLFVNGLWVVPFFYPLVKRIYKKYKNRNL